MTIEIKTNIPSIPPWKRRLYLPSYTLADSSRYVEISSQVIANWFYYKGEVGPALPGKTQRELLSYYQLIEVAFVSTMRKTMSLQKIRKARQYAQQVFNVEYPFAELKWKTEGSHLLLTLKDFNGDGEIDSLISADQSGQEAWATVMAERFEQFEYERGLALKWYLRGRDCPISIDPRVSFGAPTIKGLPTWIVKGRHESGETLPEISEDFNFDIKDLSYALEFEGIRPEVAV